MPSTASPPLGDVMLAARAIVAEVHPARVVSRLVAGLQQTTQAARVVVLLKSEGPWIIAADSQQRDPSELPYDLIRAVAERGKMLTIDDLALPPSQSDPYLARLSAGCLICVPLVRRGNAVGLVYLE